jgi:hypothetical protein
LTLHAARATDYENKKIAEQNGNPKGDPISLLGATIAKLDKKMHGRNHCFGMNAGK